MRFAVFAFSLLTFTATLAASDAQDPMAGYIGNTSISIDNQGNTIHVFYRADNAFALQSGSFSGNGTWAVDNGKLCLTYENGSGRKACVPVEPHQAGDVWNHGDRHITLVPGRALTATPEVLAALAAASRVGNTVVAKDPDGTETRLYWRPDHTFAATRPGWKTEGTWAVKGSSLFLHYAIARPNMGSDEEMKNATPRKVGEVWGMADRKVTLVAGEQLQTQ
jgi:hypothetical protein